MSKQARITAKYLETESSVMKKKGGGEGNQTDLDVMFQETKMPLEIMLVVTTGQTGNWELGFTVGYFKHLRSTMLHTTYNSIPTQCCYT